MEQKETTSFTDDPLRHAAIERLQAVKDFQRSVVVYVIINALLVFIWLANGDDTFWPIWSLLGWGAGLSFQVARIWFYKPITETDISREMARQQN